MDPIVNTDNGKTAGIISYFWIIGWLVAYFGFHQNNKTSLGSYQLRQTLLLHIVTAILWFVLDILLAAFWLATGVFSLYYLWRLVELGVFVIWLIGLIGAINGEQKPIPLLGERAQTMFPNI